MPIRRVLEDRDIVETAALLEAQVGGYPVKYVRHLARGARSAVFRSEAGAILLNGAAQPEEFSVFGPLRAPLAEGAPLGAIVGLVVSPRARGRGEGDALAAAGVRWLLTQGLRQVVAISWQPRDGRPGSAPLLRRGGCVVVGRSLMARVQPERRCPVCQGDCSCEALLYGYPLSWPIYYTWRAAARVVQAGRWLRRRPAQPRLQGGLT